MRNAWLLFVAITFGVAMALVAVSAAADRRPLPAFSVVTPAGVPTVSTQLGGSGRWLLIYVKPHCVSCDRLLTALDTWGVLQQGAARVVVVVADSPESLEARVRPLMATSGQAVQLYADATAQAAAALGVGRAPLLIGVEDGLVDWTVAGVLNDPHAVETVVRNWLAR